MQEILTSDETADLLDCETRTVEDALRDGKLPGIKLGRSWMIPREALLEVVNELAKQNLAVRMEPAPLSIRPTARGRKRVAPPNLST